ncbi:hypothetical protein C8R47DRAFT_1206546 [Mycena vitilis]|nr:hypothetical protein C8R47DRAFT_1206546 [Mycena vitilis]
MSRAHWSSMRVAFLILGVSLLSSLVALQLTIEYHTKDCCPPTTLNRTTEPTLSIDPGGI